MTAQAGFVTPYRRRAGAVWAVGRRVDRMAEIVATSQDGTAVGALDEGSGPTLLVVHPGGGDASGWDAVARGLTDDFRVVRLRRRVYLPGADTAPGHSMATEADDVLAVAEALGGPILLVGHSSGAVAGLEAALRTPSAFVGMLAYEPPMPTSSPVGGAAVALARKALDDGDPAEALRIHFRDVVRMSPTITDALLRDPDMRQVLCVYAAAQIADDEAIDALGVGADRFAALDIPVTLVEGALSPDHLKRRVADLAAVLPAAETVILPGQGHVAHLTAPAMLVEAIRTTAAKVL